MNRSILIVICDFIVLSVLSLSSGVLSTDTGNYGGVAMLDERVATQLIRKLRAKTKALDTKEQELLEAKKKAGSLAGADEQLKKVREELLKTQSQLNMLDKTAAQKGLTVSKLSKELESEMRKNVEANAKLDSALDELQTLRNKFKTAASELVDAKTKLDASTGELKEKQQLLAQREKELQSTAKRLKSAENELESTQQELGGKAQELTNKTNELGMATKELKAVRVFAKESQMNLSYTKGKLSATEKELKEARSLVEEMRNKLFTSNVELAGTRKQLDNVKTVLNKAVVDLSKTKGELSDTKGELATTNKTLVTVKSDLQITKSSLNDTRSSLENTKSILDQTKEQLQDAEKKLRSDALKKYSAAAVELLFSIRESRMLLGDYKDSAKWFLPEVTIDGQTYLVSYFDTLTGSGKTSGHSKVTELQYAVKSTDKKQQKVYPVSGPVMSLNEDSRVCLVPVTPIAERLKLITFSGLKKRGIQDIYLFKNNTFGRKSGKLDGRCSLNLSPGNNYLYIRNSTRTTDEIIKAEPGDFVITKEGDFIGVVVDVETTDFGRKQEAKCFVFPDKIDLQNAVKLPLTRKGEYYDDFARAAEQLRHKIRNLD